MADAADDKATFFEHLYSLDDSSDDENDSNDAQIFIINALPSSSVGASDSPHQSEIIDVARTPLLTRKDPLLRTTSEPTPESKTNTVIKDTPIARSHLLYRKTVGTTPLANEISFVEDTPLKQLQPTRSMSSPMPTNNSKPLREPIKPNTLGKRKRKGELNVVSEDERIFSGLNFFYLPNDDIAPARRIRITKAREHGANWIRSFDSRVTHIIVDRKISHKDVLTYLKFQELPRHIILINDDYPIDCIQFKALLDPTQRHYYVTGFDPGLQESEQGPPSFSGISDRSLQLKPVQSKPKKWDFVQSATTPPRSEESTQRQAMNQVQKFSSLGRSPGAWMASTSEKPVDDQLSVITGSTPNNGEQPQPSTTRVEAKPTESSLEYVIREVQKTQHLPLSDDDDEESEDNILDSSEGERSPARPVKRWTKKAAFTSGTWQDSFLCMTGGTGEKSSANSNARTIEVLQEMATHYDRVKDTWRTNAYRKAISALRKHPTKIITASEAFKLPFVGHRLANKIEEIVTTNSLRRLAEANLDPSEQVVKLFMGVYGVGHGQATKWMLQGHRTLDDLRHNVNLTPNQIIGIEHYEDFQTRIPRKEVTALGAIVTKTAHELDADLQVIIGGSYRRGSKDSGDIDFIITKPNSNISELNPLLKDLVTTLTKADFLVAALATPSNEEGTKWHGACALPRILPNEARPIWRRIDFLLVPADELGAALIYFTGNDIFNRSLRLLASKKGMRLNQRGLYRDIMRGPERVKITGGELVEGRDERRIFEVLGVPWRRPEERIC